MSGPKGRGKWIWLAIMMAFISACRSVSSPKEINPLIASPDRPSSTSTSQQERTLTLDQRKTLESLTRIDEYPLFTMVYRGEYTTHNLDSLRLGALPVQTNSPSSICWREWGCSLFFSSGDPNQPIYGRNFDYRYSPGLLLFTDSPHTYASVTMVDLDYLLPVNLLDQIDQAPLEKRIAFLDAPDWPFDGMNERGLTVGMAAVPDAVQQDDPNLPSIGSLIIMRRILDSASNVEEALEIFEGYNIEMGEIFLHYLIADPSGASALVEIYEGEQITHRTSDPWQVATNFLLSKPEEPEGICPRYDRITSEIDKSNGVLDIAAAFQVLQSVAQHGVGSETQWSVLYDMHNLEVHLVMGRNYSQVYHFSLVEMLGD